MSPYLWWGSHQGAQGNGVQWACWRGKLWNFETENEHVQSIGFGVTIAFSIVRERERQSKSTGSKQNYNASYNCWIGLDPIVVVSHRVPNYPLLYSCGCIEIRVSENYWELWYFLKLWHMMVVHMCTCKFRGFDTTCCVQTRDHSNRKRKISEKLYLLHFSKSKRGCLLLASIISHPH